MLIRTIYTVVDLYNARREPEYIFAATPDDAEEFAEKYFGIELPYASIGVVPLAMLA